MSSTTLCNTHKENKIAKVECVFSIFFFDTFVIVKVWVRINIRVRVWLCLGFGPG